MNKKDEFIQIYTDQIKREGASAFLEYLCSSKSDFFTAPASTRFHGNYAGGLVEHSLNVYYCLQDYLSRDRVKEQYQMNYSQETIALVALLHDVCKINVYRQEQRNKKVNGTWVQVPYYEFDDPMPYGHGEKSVYMITPYMKLSREESFAIRYNMGFSNEDSSRNVGYKFENFQLAFA